MLVNTISVDTTMRATAFGYGAVFPVLESGVYRARLDLRATSGSFSTPFRGVTLDNVGGTVTENRILFLNPPIGPAIVCILVRQPSSANAVEARWEGASTVSPGVRWPYGRRVATTKALNAKDLFRFYWNGSEWFGLAPLLDVR